MYFQCPRLILLNDQLFLTYHLFALPDAGANNEEVINFDPDIRNHRKSNFRLYFVKEMHLFHLYRSFLLFLYVM